MMTGRNRSLRFAAVLAACVGLAGVWAGTPTRVHAAESGPLVTLDADNTSAEALLQLIAGRYNINMVISPEARDARVNVHVKQVTVDDAVSMIVKAAGLSAQRIGNSIVVASSQRLADNSTTATSVISLRHADPKKVAPLLEGLGAQVRVDPATSQILLSAPIGLRGQLLQMIEGLDQPARQVELRARLIEVTTNDLQTLGIDWAKLTSFTSVITEGIPGGSTPGSVVGSPPDQLPGTLNYREFGNFGRLARQSEAWRATIDLIIQNGKGKVLSDVKLATMSDATAEIHIGDVIPYLVTGPPSSSGVLTYAVEKTDTGVQLKITPRVTADGDIIAQVEPSVSSVVAFRGPDASLPQTKERTAATSVRVKNGETIVIAGLQSDETTTTIDKLPILGDIPIIGRLFQHYKKVSVKTDLVIEITPRLL